MEEEILIVPSGSPDSYCRLCFSEVNVEPLLEPKQTHQPKQPLINLIRRYVTVRLDPTQCCAICSTCRMMLEEFERFRDRCLRCDSILTGEERSLSDDDEQDLLKLDCPHCKRSFAKKQSLELHIKNYHGRFDGSENGKFECEHCTRIFASEGHLKLHVRSLHDLGGIVANGVSPHTKKPRMAVSPRVVTPVQVLPLPPLAPLSVEESSPPALSIPNNLSSLSSVTGATASSIKPFHCTTCDRRFHFVGSLKRHVREAHFRHATAAELAGNNGASLSPARPPPEPLPVAKSYQQPTVRQPVIEPPAVDSPPDMIVPDTDELPVAPKVEPSLIHTSPIPLKSFVISLERLDHRIPAIPNHEITLGKFYYLRQQKALHQQHDDDFDLQKDYPGFAKKVRKDSKKAGPKRKRTILSAHKCDVCGLCFQSHNSLMRHKPLHTNEFPHRCDRCPIGFVRPQMLDNHKQRYHVPGAPPLLLSYCPFCARVFCSAKNVTKHVEFVHMEKVPEYVEADIRQEYAPPEEPAGEVKLEHMDSEDLLVEMFQ